LDFTCPLDCLDRRGWAGGREAGDTGISASISYAALVLFLFLVLVRLLAEDLAEAAELALLASIVSSSELSDICDVFVSAWDLGRESRPGPGLEPRDDALLGD